MFSIFFKPKQKGFTLIEMIVVIAIFLITTVIVLSNFKGFNRKSQLDLLAREMSLVIRQAQVYGTATRLSTGTNFSSYGIHINPSTTKPTSFVIFSDNNKNNRYETTPLTSELIEQFNLTGGVYISKVQSCTSDSSSSCTEMAGGLNAIFPRPKPEASFFSSIGIKAVASKAAITIYDPGITDGSVATRTIDVWNTGHIYVESELGN